jgi:diacylglycerol kinase (ATP)
VAGALTRPGVVRNPRSHANLRSKGRPAPAGVLVVQPDTPADLASDLKRFAAEGVDLLVIDGGDGTVREVLSALPGAYGDAAPVIAVLASGKTNILALDLGARPGWSLEEALARAAAEEPVLKTRSPLEVSWADAGCGPVRGFVFGLGAFVRATTMSQAVHRLGFFHGVSVAFTLAGAVIQTLFGGHGAEWRQGVGVSLSLDGEPERAGDRFLTMATTLKRLPFGLAPFGPPREGMKLLDVDAPPRRLYAALPALLAGRDAPWLVRDGYRRSEATEARLSLSEPVVIDGEIFPGGEIVVRRGAPVRFLAP